ncbi:MAG TPA: ABC transporter permease [Blastocatellia bacterium]|nr:ABC transporter permease [Blastocatellia bacterium]
METLSQDLRYGVRMLLKNPGFTAAALLALTLGIGANTAIFSVVNAVLLRPLPFEESERLVLVWEKRMALGRVRNVASFPDYYDWKAQNTVFEDMAAYRGGGFTLGGDTPERIQGTVTTPNLFSVLRVQPQTGRSFLPEEDQPGNNLVVILSHGLWQRRFAADPNIVGQTVLMNDRNYTVVGVMPADFIYPNRRTEIWVPLTPDQDDRNNRGGHSLGVIARLKPGITLDQARAEMDGIAANLEQQYQVNTGHGVNIFPLYEEVVGDIRPMLWVAFGAVGFVLLIACANVANLLLARAATRQKEIALRTALGAGRGRIVRQLLTESLLLALAGGALGVLLALWGVDALLTISPNSIPRVWEIGLDGRVLGFTLLVTLATGLFFGLIPALQASRPNLNEALKEGGRTLSASFRRNRLRSIFVISEVAICLVLLIGAGLMARSFIRLLDVDPGFNPENVLTANVSLSPIKYREPHQRVAYYRESLEKIKALPGVQAAGIILDLPMSGNAASRYFRIEGRPPQPPGQGYNTNLNATAPGYFKTMGIPLIAGRDFDERDVIGAPEVVIINEAMAREFWPDEDPLGKRLAVGDGPWRTVIGVVGNVKYRGLDADTRQEMYWPYYQMGFSGGTFVARTGSDPENMAAAVRSAMQEVDRDQPVYNIRAMEEVMSETVAPRRFNMLLLAIFAGVALALAAVGIYGVMAYTVNRRTHEIGIRMALGASRGDVLKLVVGQGMALAAVGVSIGLVAAYGLTRLLASLLFGVSDKDPVTFIALSLLLAGVALLACYVPARRATKVDPMVALRNE